MKKASGDYPESLVFKGYLQLFDVHQTAEREGFEPSLPFPVNQFSRLAHSTTLPPLLVVFGYNYH